MADTPVYRRDPLTGGWVVVAPARAANVQGLGPDPLAGLPAPPGPCPFCPGNESEAEPTVAAWPSEGPWRVRSVGNRYPVARADVGALTAPLDALDEAPAFGLHEVIVEAPEHDRDLVDLDEARLAEILGAYRDRVRAFEAHPEVAQVSLFRNRGRRAGSSQPHPHAQVAGLAVLGPEQERRWRRAKEHHAATGQGLLASVVEAELGRGTRVVESTERFVALVAFAPQHNYETWIVPRDPRGSFAGVSDAALAPLAETLGRVLRAVLHASGRRAYNLIFRLPPARTADDPAASWYLELAPRGGGAAGFELSSGMALLTVSPEVAAERVRGAMRR